MILIIHLINSSLNKVVNFPIINLDLTNLINTKTNGIPPTYDLISSVKLVKNPQNLDDYISYHKAPPPNQPLWYSSDINNKITEIQPENVNNELIIGKTGITQYLIYQLKENF